MKTRMRNFPRSFRAQSRFPNRQTLGATGRYPALCLESFFNAGGQHTFEYKDVPPELPVISKRLQAVQKVIRVNSGKVSIRLALIICVIAIYVLVLTRTSFAGELLLRLGEGDGPTKEKGRITLLSVPGAGEKLQNNVIVVEPAELTVFGLVRIDFDLKVNAQARGVGVVLTDALKLLPGTAVKIEDWAEPNAKHSIGIGLDLFNPRTTDRFNEDGNIYDRPQREVSLHVQGQERVNRRSPVDFATQDFSSGKDVPVVIGVRFVTGGVVVTMLIGEAEVYQDEFLPGVSPFTPVVVIGASSTDPAARVEVTNLKVALDGKLEAPGVLPIDVMVMEEKLISAAAGTRELRVPVAMPDGRQGPFARVLAHITLAAPRVELQRDREKKVEFDQWDRKAALYIFGPDNQRYELARLVTPFARPWTWTVDVTDFVPLFREQRDMSMFVDTWQGGFLATVRLEFFPVVPGQVAPRTPISVVNLWQGEPTYGQANEPIANFLTDKIVFVPADATSAKVRLTVTGHGQAPNTSNAAEFMPIERTLTVADKSFKNTLWTTDNYLNPCRPQAGTWKFDRAGWGPGRVVAPWIIDVSDLLRRDSKVLELSYTTQPYVNLHDGPGEAATLWFDGVVVFYKD